MGNSAHIDFETRSTVDLKKTGVHKYAEHKDTGVWCMAYAIEEEPVKLWHPDLPAPKDLFEYMADGGLVMAHNAAFELVIWNILMRERFDWPTLPIKQVRCTMAMAMAMSLPGALANAAAAVNLDIGKDMEGKRLMMQMAKPRKVNPDGSIMWWDDITKKKRLFDYCRQDVEVERKLEKRLLTLPPSEQEMWELDQTINGRGVNIDLIAVDRALELVDSEKIRLDSAMHKITKGELNTCNQVSALVSWCNERVDPIEPVPSLAKADVAEVLSRPDLPPEVRRALELRAEAAKASTAKLKAMVESASDDGQARGLFQYHGANTGRWAGRRIQLQNMPRPDFEQDVLESFIDCILAGTDRDELEFIFGPLMNIISSALRGMIKARDGEDFIAADLNAIEARVLAWLAGEEETLRLFSGGGDVYCTQAEGIYLYPVNKKDNPDERKVGKVAILALGYQGGIAAFYQMARGYDVDFTPIWPAIKDSVNDEELEKAQKAAHEYRSRGGPLLLEQAMACDVIKQRWRAANVNVVQYWRNLDDAAKTAVMNPGQTFTAGAPGREVKFRMAGSFLFCQLPSKRCLCYPYPNIVEEAAPWSTKEKPATVFKLVYKGADDQGRWGDVDTYGGKLAENITQAVARDVLAEGIKKCESKGYPIVMHVHDEIVAQVKKGFGSVEEVEKLIATVPHWAKGLPLSAEGWRGERYRK